MGEAGWRRGWRMIRRASVWARRSLAPPGLVPLCGGQLGERFQIVAALNHAGVHQRGGFLSWSGNRFFRSNFFRHAPA